MLVVLAREKTLAAASRRLGIDQTTVARRSVTPEVGVSGSMNGVLCTYDRGCAPGRRPHSSLSRNRPFLLLSAVSPRCVLRSVRARPSAPDENSNWPGI